MHDRGKSDGPVLPAKPSNKPGRPGAEVVEGRGLAEGNAASARWTILSSSEAIPSGLSRPSAFGMYTLRDGFAR